MADIVQFAPRKRKPNSVDYPIITKVVDGKIVECVNVDALSLAQRARYFATSVPER
jgi:hypothetical protein